MHEPSQSTGYEKARKISNNNISMERFKYNKKTNYCAVGRVSNRDGWKGKGKDSMGTGFMIDDHTFLTNSHVVEDSSEKKTKPKHVKLQLKRDGKKIPYEFQATKITKVPSYDIAVVNTKENMRKKANAKPLKLASDKKIKNLKYRNKLYSVGYPKLSGDNTKPYKYHLCYLQHSSNQSELMTKDFFRSGNSGSPIINNGGEVFALRTYGYNPDGNATDKYGKAELAGGESIQGKPKKTIRNHME